MDNITLFEGLDVPIPSGRQQLVQELFAEILNLRIQVPSDAPPRSVPDEIGLILVAITRHCAPFVGPAPCGDGSSEACGCIGGRSKWRSALCIGASRGPGIARIQDRKSVV